MGWNDVLMPKGARIHLIASDVPCTYGMDVNWGFMVGEVVSGFRGWDFVGWDMCSMVFTHIHLYFNTTHTPCSHTTD